MNWHSQIGLVVLAALGGRVFYRMTTKIPAHIPGPAWEHYSSLAVHTIMYPMMFSIPFTGVIMGYYGGGGLPLGPFRIPGMSDPKDADMKFAKDQTDWHKWLASCMEILVPMHIAAAGYHVALGKDPLSRMAPAEMKTIASKVEAAWRTRPGAMIGGALMAGWGGLWIGSSLAEYLVSGSGGPMVAPAAAGQQGRVITVDELELHNKPEDLWIAVDGKVSARCKCDVNISVCLY
jgi:cytochrome b561